MPFDKNGRFYDDESSWDAYQKRKKAVTDDLTQRAQQHQSANKDITPYEPPAEKPVDQTVTVDMTEKPFQSELLPMPKPSFGQKLKNFFTSLAPEGSVGKKISAGANEFGSGLVPDFIENNPKFMGEAANVTDKIHNDNIEQIGSGAAKTLNVAGQVTSAVVGGEALAPIKAIEGINLLNQTKTVAGGLKAALPAVEKTLFEKGLTVAGNTAIAGAGQEMVKGLTSPNLEDRTLPAEFGAGLHRWTGTQYNTAGYGAKMLGYNNLADNLINLGHNVNDGYESEAGQLKGWSSLLDPRYWASSMGENAPTTLAFIPLGLAGRAAAGATAGMLGKTGLKIGAFGTAVMETLGMGAATAPLEAAMEASTSYEEAYKREISLGKPPQLAHQIAMDEGGKTFKGNLALLMATNSLEFGTAFMPKGLKGVASSIGMDTPAARMIGSSFMEGGEEVAQQAIQDHAAGKPININTPDYMSQFLMGAAMGQMHGMAGVMSENPNERAFNSIYSIQNGMLTHLSDETRSDMQEALADAKAQGIPEDQAMDRIREELAQTEEGKNAIAQATQDVVKSEQMKQQQAEAPPITQQTAEGQSTTAPSEQTPTSKPIRTLEETKAYLEEARKKAFEELQKAEKENQQDPDAPHARYAEAVDFVRRTGNASMNALQKEFKTGYTDNAKMLERMEAEGIVTPYDGTGPRQVIGFEAQPTAEQPTAQPPAAEPTAQPTQAPTKLAVGDTVTHKSFKGQEFTVTGTKGDYVSLRSAKGGEMKDVHKSALTPMVKSDSGQSELNAKKSIEEQIAHWTERLKGQKNKDVIDGISQTLIELHKKNGTLDQFEEQVKSGLFTDEAPEVKSVEGQRQGKANLRVMDDAELNRIANELSDEEITNQYGMSGPKGFAEAAASELERRRVKDEPKPEMTSERGDNFKKITDAYVTHNPAPSHSVTVNQKGSGTAMPHTEETTKAGLHRFLVPQEGGRYVITQTKRNGETSGYHAHFEAKGSKKHDYSKFPLPVTFMSQGEIRKALNGEDYKYGEINPEYDKWLDRHPVVQREMANREWLRESTDNFNPTHTKSGVPVEVKPFSEGQYLYREIVQGYKDATRYSGGTASKDSFVPIEQEQEKTPDKSQKTTADSNLAKEISKMKNAVGFKGTFLAETLADYKALLKTIAPGAKITFVGPLTFTPKGDVATYGEEYGYAYNYDKGSYDQDGAVDTISYFRPDSSQFTAYKQIGGSFTPIISITPPNDMPLAGKDVEYDGHEWQVKIQFEGKALLQRPSEKKAGASWIQAIASESQLDVVTPKTEETKTPEQPKVKTVQASDRTDNNLTQSVAIQGDTVKVTSKASNLDHELLPQGFDANTLKMLSHTFSLADYQKAEKSHANPNWARSQFFKKQINFDKVSESIDHSPLLDRLIDSQIRALNSALAKLEEAPKAEKTKTADTLVEINQKITALGWTNYGYGAPSIRTAEGYYYVSPIGVGMPSEKGARLMDSGKWVGAFVPDAVKSLVEQYKAKINEQAPPKVEPLKDEPAPNVLNDHHAKMKALADQARERIKKKYGSNGNTLNSGLPLDLMTDLSIIGYTKILDGIADFKAWADEMVKESPDGEKIRVWLPGIFGQAQHLASLPDTELGDTLEQMLASAFGEVPADSLAILRGEITSEDMTKSLGDSTILDSKGEEANATGTMGPNGETPLEGTQSNDVQGTASKGTTGSSSGERPGTNQGSASEPDSQGNGLSASVGDSSDNVDISSKRGPTKRDVTPITGNYVITDDDLGMKGKKNSFKSNVAAIKLMKTIMAENRAATPDEQKVLVQYVGWGGIAEPFSPSYKMPQDWAAEAQELRELLTPEEYEFVADTINNAHYTSVPIIRSIYDGLRHLGFEQGRVLEPSMGIGHFIGLMPSDMAQRSRVTGIEIDPVTGNIAKLLYPKSDVRVQGFEETKIADGFYDLVVGNVPFANISVTDAEYSKKNKGLTDAIHNYFIAKAIDKVRPGGIVMVLTSRYTLDSNESNVRRYIASKADLVGAVRLPNTAFKKNAGTSVVTDLLILQKREEGQSAKDLSWVNVQPMALMGSNQPIPINSYFHTNPSHMLGNPAFTSGMYGGKEFTLNPQEGVDLTEALQKVLQSLPENIIPKRAKPSTEDATPKELVPAPSGVKENSFVFHGNNLYMNVNGHLEPAKTPKNAHGVIRGLLGIRDAVKAVLTSQLTDGATDAQMDGARKQLNTVYDAFVKEHGPINKKENVKLFAQDPDAYLLLALENYDSEKNTATKRDIFTKRTVQKFMPATKADSVESALAITLNEIGTVNFNRMEQLTGKSEAQLIQELKGRIYFDPSSNWWVTNDDYLSGNVKAKLQAARNLAEMDPTYQENVDALLEVQPADLTKDDIDISLGAHWIPTSVYRDFASHLFEVNGDAIRVQYENSLNEWMVEIPHKDTRSRLKRSVQGNARWGTRDYDALDLLNKIMNYKSVKIMRKDSDGNKWFDKKATVAAKLKMNEITEEFTNWLNGKERLVGQLVNEYNDKFVTDRLRTYDGSHLTFPGMNPAITLKQHQKDAVWRAVQNGNTLLAHAVGAGKTFEMIASMMEMKRLGIVNKPLWTVPNHLVEQMGADFLKLYPAANILVANKGDFEAKNRKQLFAKIATGNYDAIIIAHSSFGKVPMSANAVRSFYQTQLDQLELAIEASVKAGTKNDTGLAKKIRAARKRLIEKMNKQMAKLEKDDAVSFEELGIDSLVVDEAHEFKNLFYATSMTRVGGLGNTEGSGKAFDLFMKTRYLQHLNGGRGVIFATGTPVSNSLAEMYTMQRYLQYDELKNRGVANFDAWASQFAKITNAMELAPEGKGFRQVTKITDMVNLPELQHMFRSFADVKTADELLAKGLITRPELAGGTRTPVLVEGSEALHSFVNELAERAAAVRSGAVDPSTDNMLKIVGEGRKAALDMRLVDPSLSDDPNSKVNVAVDNMVSIWKATKSYSVTDKDGSTRVMKDGTQIIFLDLSTPKAEKTDKDGNVVADESNDASDISVYDDIRKKLTLKGVPRDQIAFIHDAKTDADKEILFRKVNNGKVRFLLGSSQKMGAGMNVQTKLVALHHLDVPWRPMDVEQREGRILRQGNENPEVSIFSYNTEGSFDAYMWQLIASKATIVDQTLNGDIAVRRRQDPSAMEMSANQIKALASGDDRIIEHANLSQDTQEMGLQVANLQDTVGALKRKLASLPEKTQYARDRLALFEKDQVTAGEIPTSFSVSLDGNEYTDRKIAGENLIAMQDQASKDLKDGEYTDTLGMYRGFEMMIERKESLFKSSESKLQPFFNGKASKYYFSIGTDAIGAARSMEMALDDIDKYVKSYQKDIQENAHQVVDAQKGVDETEQKLDKVRTQLNEKMARKIQLEQELDLAPSAEETISETDEDDSEHDFEEHSFASVPQGGSVKRAVKGGGSVFQQVIDTDKHISPVTTERAADFLARFLDTTIRSMKRKASAEGTFNDKNETGTIRPRSVGEWRVMGHELGHAFFLRYKNDMQLNPVLQDELLDLADIMYPGTLPATKKKRLNEGFAEFFYLYSVDPVMATQHAPNMVTFFDSFVAQNADLSEMYAKLRTIIDNDLDITNPLVKGLLSVTSMLREGDAGHFELPWYERFQFTHVDYTLPAKHMDNELTDKDRIKLHKMLAINDASAKAVIDFNGVAIDHEGKHITHDNNGRELRPLKKIMEDALTEIVKVYGWKKQRFSGMKEKMGAIHIFTAIAVANRVKERISHDFQYLPMTETEADSVLARAAQDFPNVLAFAHEYADTLSFIILEKLERAGQLSPEARQRIDNGSDFYMPFYYNEKKASKSGTDATGRTTKKVVKHFTGRKAPVLNLFQATALKLGEMEQAIEFQRTSKILDGMLREEGMGKYGVKYTPSPTMVRISADDMQKQQDKWIEDMITHGADFTQYVAGTGAQAEKFFKPGTLYDIPASERVIMYKTGEQVTFWKLEKDVYDMVMALKPEALGSWLRFLSGVNRYFRGFNLLTLTYMKGAVSRDGFAAIMQSKHRAGMLKELLSAAARSMGLNEKEFENVYRHFVAAGGFSGAAENYYASQNRAVFDEGILHIGYSGWGKVMMNGKKYLTKTLKSPFEALRIIDETPRIAEFVATWKSEVKGMGHDEKQLWKEYIEGGMDVLPQDAQDAMERILVDSAYNSREVTANFGLHGTSKVSEKFQRGIPFLKGTAQGMYRSGRQIKNNKAATATFSLGGLTLISILSMLAMGADDDDKRKLQSMNDVARDKYWWFPVPGVDGMYVNISKPYEYSLPTNLIERFMDHYTGVEGARKPMQNWMGAAKTAYSFPYMHQAVQVMMELNANQTSEGFKIVPEGERNVAKDEQYDPRTTSHVSKWLAQGYNATARLFTELNGGMAGDPKVGISPRQVDYAVKSLTNVYGDTFLRSLDNTDRLVTGQNRSGTAGVEYWPVVGSLLYGRAEGANRTMEKFYTDKAKAETLNGEAQRLLDKTKAARAAGQAVPGKPYYATPENILLIHNLPMITAISKELADNRNTVKDKLDNATPEQRRTMQLKLKYTEQLASGFLYGVQPVITKEEAGLSQSEADKLYRHIRSIAQDAAIAEKKKKGGATESVTFLTKFLAKDDKLEK